ncbi:MBOAT family O-acyltransferase [Coprobacter fastidiosus]|jgi:alginate O-acetyltransferase complex protein AlgI|uniref:MBOAT family O-acyltransferase n=1 Tax=Coprobacter fastidiosus TaxID=1099853 RepID=UPI00266EC97A|nr:MBOAT family protein [Coprobacter fastidiosus]
MLENNNWLGEIFEKLGLDIHKLGVQFLYDPNNPMLFNSGFFFFLFLAFLFLYRYCRKNELLRNLYVMLFSFYFYYKSSGIYLLVLIFVCTFDFFIGRLLYRTERKVSRKWLVTLSLIVNICMLGYFKYTNFIFDLFYSAVNRQFEPFDIVLPVGISFFTFQSMSYIIDIYRKQIEPLQRWRDYAFYVSFFPQLVAGPIVRARDFIPQMKQPVFVSGEMFGRGMFLIMAGLFKKVIISDYISLNFVDRIFDNPTLYTGFENLMGVYAYALQIYCDFSGYSDMAIGIALLLGFRFNINFDSPYKSTSITEFWRRWHISLSSWLRDYLYISMGGNRKGKVRTYINLMLTMLIGGFWHGASLLFVFWGAWHGLLLVLHKWFRSIFPASKEVRSRWYWTNVLSIILTFNLVCIGWVFFRSPSMEVAKSVFSRIFTEFHPEIVWDFISGYANVLFFICLGFLLHFLPHRYSEGVARKIEMSPVSVKAFAFALLIVLVIQIKSSELQPFIYFQF